MWRHDQKTKLSNVVMETWLMILLVAIAGVGLQYLVSRGGGGGPGHKKDDGGGASDAPVQMKRTDLHLRRKVQHAASGVLVTYAIANLPRWPGEWPARTTL